MLLTQIEAGKLNQEKQIKKQLATAPSIKDLKIVGQVRGLRDFTATPAPYDIPLYNTPLPSPSISDDDETE